MLQRLGQIVTVVLVSSALVPSYANAQRAAGAPVSVAVAPHIMAAPVAAAPVMHANAAHFTAGAHAPTHLGPSAIAHPTAPHHPVPVKPVSNRPPTRTYPAPSQPGYTNIGVPFPNSGYYNNGFNDGGIPVPGLGFDYPHFAAVHPGVFNHHFHGGGVVPFIGGGIYVPFEYYSEPYPAPEQPVEPEVEPEQAQAAQQQEYSAPPAYAPPRERPNASLAPSPEYHFRPPRWERFLRRGLFFEQRQSAVHHARRLSPGHSNHYPRPRSHLAVQ